ncbi:MAG: sulfate adenylyltransferase [Sphingobacteriales bacterium]|nr:sulfate adenylyltransferase [Sphingobacteriales bacterium]
MDILRITTAGSVDDGKSTLIGRLLYDTRSITRDKLEAIEAASKRKGFDFTDLSLLTDGLIAEREQGITIDVAHIYFSTSTRKYIIADSPGHVEYTRNMITGASNASVSLILIDARKGVIEQTKRHFYIASLLRIKHVVVCINKMDLAGFDQKVFENIKRDFEAMVVKVGFEGQEVKFIPLAAREGDNIVFSSVKMPWYKDETLLEFLENISVAADNINAPARFPVQYVVRPHTDEFHDFRGYAGKVESGSFAKGEEVMVLPSLRSSKIKSIHNYTEEKEEVLAKESVVITLDDEADISRGNMLIKCTDGFTQLTGLNATICWMDESPGAEGKIFFLQHGPNRVKAKITTVGGILDIHSLETNTDKKVFQLNDIGDIVLKLAKPVFADLYVSNTANGSFILIDEFNNNTVAVGFVR